MAMPTRQAPPSRAVSPGNAHKRVGPGRSERMTSMALAPFGTSGKLARSRSSSRHAAYERVDLSGRRGRHHRSRDGAVLRWPLDVVDLPDLLETGDATVWPAGMDRRSRGGSVRIPGHADIDARRRLSAWEAPRRRGGVSRDHWQLLAFVRASMLSFMTAA